MNPDENVPIGWGMRTVANYTAGDSGALPVNRSEDWRVYEVENMHFRQEQNRLNELREKGLPVPNIPVGWEDRDNAKTLHELSMSKNSTNIAVAEVCAKPPPPLAGGPISAAASSSSSSSSSMVASDLLQTAVASTAGVGGSAAAAAAPLNIAAPGSNSVTINVSPGGYYVAGGGVVNVGSGSGSGSDLPRPAAPAPTQAPAPAPAPAPAASLGPKNADIVKLLESMQQQQQTTMAQLTTVILGISDRLSAVEFKLDELKEASSGGSSSSSSSSSR